MEIKIKIGRLPDNDIVIDNLEISKYHAVITKITDNIFLIDDLESANGTFVDGVQIKRKVIKLTNEIMVADQKIDLKKFLAIWQNKNKNSPEKLKTIFKIGKDQTNDIIINEETISRVHATLKIIDFNNFEVTDEKSTNGIFINNVKIVSKANFILTDKIKFGKIYNFDIRQHIDLSKYVSSKINLSKPLFDDDDATVVNKDEDNKPEFENLKLIYEDYITAKNKLQHGSMWKSTGIRALLALIPGVGGALGIVASTALNTSEKIIAIDEELKITYICPKCKNFLGFLPWEALVTRNKCNYCHTKWLEK